MTDWNQAGVALMALAFVAQGVHLWSWVWALRAALGRRSRSARETRAKVRRLCPGWPEVG